jgi:hypothetical protein
MGSGFTKSTLATRIVHNAWVQALIFYASSIVRTVNVMLTFTSLDRYTSAVWISCKSWWTFTVGPMVVYSALSTNSTWIINAAGVNTSSISAGLTGGTFIITRAANLNWGNYFITANNSIASVAFKTGTTHGSGRGSRIDLASCMGNTW